ncbi:neuropeptide Y receptor type 1-like [Stylophora pistillata]|uniref:neuropeptide Y receptor type 1-like n=1 Tax=Stylophora pistillata TaxID=50429 RepID=UPI000C04AF66|nr:neuropeptide Y receptor type 1-like [Stylophora pistillata]
MNGTKNSSVQDCIGDPSKTATAFQALAYVIIFVVSLVGNGGVLFAIYRNKQLSRSINYFVFNMAVSDLFNPLTIMPITFVEIVSGSATWRVDNPWLLGNILCKLSYFLPDVSVAVSIESLLLISLDRLVAVVFPLRTRHLSSKVHQISILCVWITAIAVHAPYFYTFRLEVKENKTSCVANWGPAFNHLETHERFVTATFVTFVLMPICVLVIVYSVIAWNLCKERKKMQESGNHQKKLSKQSKKIVCSSVAIIAAFAFCMIPQLVSIFTRVFIWNREVPPNCTFRTMIPFIASFMLHAWSAVNPCICFIFIKTYRDTLKRFFCSRWSNVNYTQNLDLSMNPATLASRIKKCRSTKV